MNKNFDCFFKALIFSLVICVLLSCNEDSAVSTNVNCYLETGSRVKSQVNNLEAYHLIRVCDDNQFKQNRIYVAHTDSDKRTLIYESESEKPLTVYLVWKDNGKLYLVFSDNKGKGNNKEKKYESNYNVTLVNSDILEYFDENETNK